MSLVEGENDNGLLNIKITPGYQQLMLKKL